MDAKKLHSATQEVVKRMMVGELSRMELHQDLVKLIKLEVPGVDGRRVWSVLTWVIHHLVTSCKMRLLWRNCFSLKGVHGKGSKRQLEYHPEYCGSCTMRMECLTNVKGGE